MSWTLDYRIRTGVEYTPPIYLPRLQGANAIPKLTHTKFRSSCSPNCIHSWRPRPPPPTPPPPPVNPMNVYKLHWMRNKLYGLDESGSFRTMPTEPPTPTKYDLLMRNVVLGIRPSKAQQQRNTKLVGYRASTNSIRESVQRSSLKRVKSEVIRRSKLKERKSLAIKKPCYLEEMRLFERHNDQLEKRTRRFEADYWHQVDKQYAELERLDEAKTEVMNAFPEHIAAFYIKFITRNSQRQAKEEVLREELTMIEEENRSLADEIIQMKQYHRIGRQRDQAIIDQLAADIARQDSETQHALDNRPFVTPKITMPTIAALPTPPITRLLEGKVNDAHECVDLLMTEIDALKLEKRSLVASQKATRAKFENKPKIYQNADDDLIPHLDIPLRRELRF